MGLSMFSESKEKFIHFITYQQQNGVQVGFEKKIKYI